MVPVAKHLEPLKGGKIPVEILVRGKDEAANFQIFKDLAEVIKKSGKKVGAIAKDSAQGPFVNDWRKVYPSEVEGVEEVDVTPAFSAFLAIKDDTELVRPRSLQLYKKYTNCVTVRKPCALPPGLWLAL